jgi:hypothetical protein
MAHCSSVQRLVPSTDIHRGKILETRLGQGLWSAQDQCRWPAVYKSNVFALQLTCSMVDCVWNVMAHAQKTDFIFQRNRWVHLNQQGHQSSWLLAAEVCASAVLMLDTPWSEVVWRVLATHSIRQFPLHFPSHASPCAITFQLDFPIGMVISGIDWRTKIKTSPDIVLFTTNTPCTATLPVHIVYYHNGMYQGTDKSLARPGRKRLTGHLQPRRNWPNWASSVFITHPVLRIWPCQTTTCSLDWKNNRKGSRSG